MTARAFTRARVLFTRLRGGLPPWRDTIGYLLVGLTISALADKAGFNEWAETGLAIMCIAGLALLREP